MGPCRPVPLWRGAKSRKRGAFGHMTVDALADDDVKRWLASLGERPGIANSAMPGRSVVMCMAELR